MILPLIIMIVFDIVILFAVIFYIGPFHCLLFLVFRLVGLGLHGGLNIRFIFVLFLVKGFTCFTIFSRKLFY